MNQRKDRLNNLNGRIAALSTKTLKLYNCDDAMKVESPAQYPEISTSKNKNMHPHQSIFYDRQNILDEEDASNPMRSKNEEFNLPELYSM